MASNRNQNGFTLIELSIVLVLIGLIIGGVLKGQELISSTRLKMTVSQWDAVKAAVNSFQDKYVAIPGDYDQASSYIDGDLDDGDGNGIVGTQITDDGIADGLSGTPNEHEAAWSHLEASGFLAAIDGTNNVLPAKTPGASFHILYGTFGTGTGGEERTAHWLRLQSGADAATAPTADPLSPKEAAEIDRKYDDGSFVAGSIHADSASGGTCTPTTLSDANTCSVVFELF